MPAGRKVLHIASHGLNVGDGALNGVIRARLSRLSPFPIAYTLVDSVLDGAGLAASDVDAFDLVIVGGGGAINNSARAAACGVELPMTLDAYRRARVPFAFVALGYNLFAGQRLRHAEALRALLAASRERGDLFSVRNDGSVARLAGDLGDCAKSVSEIPDPGFFVETVSGPPVEAGERPYLLLQVAGDRLGDRLGASTAGRVLWPRHGLGRFADALADFALRAWRAFELDILVAPHIPADAVLGAAVLARIYRRAGRAAIRRPFRLLGTPHPTQAARFFSAYAAAELVLGMRGHAAICATGLGRPFIGVASHPKIRGFLERCGLGAWCVPVTGNLADQLFDTSRALLDGGLEAYRAQRDTHTADFAARLDAYLCQVVARFENG
jgi:polysaccharide pyruvyl transferase WcaK-like protein